MELVYCKYNDSYRFEVAYNLCDYKKIEKKIISKNELNKKIGYYTLPCTFDIETSTILNKEKTKVSDKDIYEGFMYHWQFCICGYVFFGRTWEELMQLIDYIDISFSLHDLNVKMVVYVHNLSYEFQFMYRFFEIKKVFATDKHKVLKFSLNDNFEFRCSYYLSNMNLAKFIENSKGTHHNKGSGDLDYSICRTPETKLNYIERGYCYNDVLGLYEALLSSLESDDIKSIPLTNTGYVRRDCRRAMAKNKANKFKFKKNKLDLHLYLLLRESFRGGDTASNRLYTNMLLENVYSYDYASSYPFVMLSEKFPTGQFMNGSIESEEELLEYNNRFCTIGVYTFENMRLKDNVTIPYISLSKCRKIIKNDNPFTYNGRVMNCQYCTIALTNIDFSIINEQYDFDVFYVDDFHFARKDYLPKELRDEILHYFYLKSLLKGDPEKNYEYMKSKNKLNSIFGMMVTNILHDEIIFNGGEWEKIEKQTQEQLDRYYNSYNSFLTYQWGVWVTAYARRNLNEARKLMGIDHVYNDTDSVKAIGNKDDIIKDFNRKIIERCEKENIVHYVDVNGKRIYMGILEKDAYYTQFKTLGAKKYAYVKDNKLSITVSGLNSKRGAKELAEKGGIEMFKNGVTFYDTDKQCAYYNDDEIHQLTVNGCTFITGSNIALVDVTYTLGISETMLSIIALSQPN